MVAHNNTKNYFMLNFMYNSCTLLRTERDSCEIIQESVEFVAKPKVIVIILLLHMIICSHRVELHFKMQSCCTIKDFFEYWVKSCLLIGRCIQEINTTTLLNFFRNTLKIETFDTLQTANTNTWICSYLFSSSLLPYWVYSFQSLQCTL